jgi:putative transposase
MAITPGCLIRGNQALETVRGCADGEAAVLQAEPFRARRRKEMTRTDLMRMLRGHQGAFSMRVLQNAGGPMKRSKFTDEQILKIVREGEARRKVADLCRTKGITEQTYYRWKAKYGGMELSEMQRLKALDDENRH